ncbi:TPA: hypothetical protein ACS72K_001093 [Providencia alcalifaciens]
MDNIKELNLLRDISEGVDGFERKINKAEDSLMRSENIRNEFRNKHQEILNRMPEKYRKSFEHVLNRVDALMGRKIEKQKEAITIMKDELEANNNALEIYKNKDNNVEECYALDRIARGLHNVNDRLAYVDSFKHITYREQNFQYKLASWLDPKVKDEISEYINNFEYEDAQFLEITRDFDDERVDLKKNFLHLEKEELIREQGIAISRNQYSVSTHNEVAQEITNAHFQVENQAMMESIFIEQTNQVINLVGEQITIFGSSKEVSFGVEALFGIQCNVPTVTASHYYRSEIVGY